MKKKRAAATWHWKRVSGYLVRSDASVANPSELIPIDDLLRGLRDRLRAAACAGVTEWPEYKILDLYGD